MGRLTPWKWVMDQWSSIPPFSQFKADLTGKTVIVTGANTGLGLETARHFATLNPKKLIIACRNAQKADNAVLSIRNTTGCRTVEAWSFDLANFDSVRAFADRFEEEGGGHLDILVENAGLWATTYIKTPDDCETSLQVNYLGPCLLAILLLPSLLKAPSSPPTPRIVLVASEAHFFARSLPEVDSPNILEKLNDEHYCRISKSRLKDDDGTVFRYQTHADLLHALLGLPTSHTSDGFTHGGPLVIIKYLGEFLFARTTQVGSLTTVWAALGGQQGEIHGRYTSRCRVEEESDLVLSEEGSEYEQRLWSETVNFLSKVDRRVEQIVDENLNSL